MLYLSSAAPRFFSLFCTYLYPMYRYHICTILLLGCLWACSSPTPSSDALSKNTIDTVPTKTTESTPIITIPPYVAELEAAHHKADFLQKGVVKFDVTLSFGGKERLNGTITALTNSTQARIDYANGNSVLYKDHVVYAPAELATEEQKSSTRFSAYTWPYFFLFPYKLSDPGTQWTDYANNNLNGATYDTQKLSFKAGIGDDPNDWYITYARPTDHLIEVAAYIVTAGGTPKEEAEQDPHAIKYEDYQLIEGIPIAHHWTFWGWKKEDGLSNQLGEATISNVHFIDASPELFDIPEGHTTL